MSDKDDGGDAFPTIKQFGESGEYWQEQGPGMTLRDYFAAKALDGLMSGRWKADIHDIYTADACAWANSAYVFADAMIEARKK